MKIQISKRMRQLRAEKGNTQEELACYLGITPQAVSKWERGEGMPDITVVPDIAKFYDVSIDDLFGVTQNARIKLLEDYRKKDGALLQENKHHERVLLWRKALKEFPNDPDILHALSFSLRADDIKSHADEIIAIGKALLNSAQKSGVYFGAINNICYAYAAKGDTEEAIKYASMAGRYIGTENQLMIHILEGEEAVSFCKWNIETLTDLIATNARVMLKKGNFSLNAQIRISQSILKLFYQIFEGHNYGFYHCRVSDWNYRLAECYINPGQHEDAITHLQAAARHARAFDELTDGEYTSALLECMKYQKTCGAGSQVKQLHERMSEQCFDAIRDDRRFKSIFSPETA